MASVVGCTQQVEERSLPDTVIADPPKFCGRRVCVTTKMPVSSITEQRGPDFSVYRLEYMVELEGEYDGTTMRFGFYEGDHPNVGSAIESRFCSVEMADEITIEGFRSSDSQGTSYLATREYSGIDDFILLAPTKAHFWFESLPSEWPTGFNKLHFTIFGEPLDFSECIAS